MVQTVVWFGQQKFHAFWDPVIQKVVECKRRFIDVFLQRRKARQRRDVFQIRCCETRGETRLTHHHPKVWFVRPAFCSPLTSLCIHIRIVVAEAQNLFRCYDVSLLSVCSAGYSSWARGDSIRGSQSVKDERKDAEVQLKLGCREGGRHRWTRETRRDVRQQVNTATSATLFKQEYGLFSLAVRFKRSLCVRFTLFLASCHDRLPDPVSSRLSLTSPLSLLHSKRPVFLLSLSFRYLLCESDWTKDEAKRWGDEELRNKTDWLTDSVCLCCCWWRVSRSAVQIQVVTQTLKLGNSR